MQGQIADISAIDSSAEMEVDTVETITSPPSSNGDVAKFPLRSRLRSFLADFNIIEGDARIPDFFSSTVSDALLGYAFHSNTTSGRVLQALSEVAAIPGTTFLLVKHFRPLLVDLFGRWMLTDSKATKETGQWERELFILAEVVEFVPELWSSVHVFLSQSPFLENTPLAFLPKNGDEPFSPDPTRLQLILLSTYRILSSDPRIGVRNYWPQSIFERLYRGHPDKGVRYLAVQCWIKLNGLPEMDRRVLEDKWIGRTDNASAFIAYGWVFHYGNEGETVTGTMKLETIEGWGLRIREAMRERKYVNLGSTSSIWSSEEEQQDGTFDLQNDFGSFTAIVGGQLSLRTELPKDIKTLDHNLHVEIQSNQLAIRAMAKLLSRRLPILITGMASAGKTHILHHLSSMIYPATAINSRILTISLADTSIDAKALLGSYVSSPTQPGTFTWVEGALTKAVRSGRWIVLEDVDRAGQEVLSLFARIADSLGKTKAVGGRALLDIPGRNSIEAGEGFALFATRKVNTTDYSIPAVFLGHNYFHEIVLPAPSELEVQSIMDAKYPRLAGPPVQALSLAYQRIKEVEQKFAKTSLPGSGARRSYGLRDLEKWCARVEKCLPITGEIAMHIDPSAEVMRFSNPSVQDEVFLEAVDIFLGSFPYHLAAQAERRQAIARILGDALGLGQERSDWLLDKRTPQVEVQGDARARQSSMVRVGRASLHGLAPRPHDHQPVARPYAMTKPSAILLERIAVGISLSEPMLLVGETGTGKTTAVQHVASILNRPLTVINLSTQTESADLLGGFRPVDAAIPARHLHARWLDLFRRSFSRKKNEKYEEGIRKAIVSTRWKRVTEMWTEAGKVARGRVQKRLVNKDHALGETTLPNDIGESSSRKRRKVADEELTTADLQTLLQEWDELQKDVDTFELQHVKAGGKLVFAFVEGPLVQALRCGEWILLDEVNLASQETLESLSAIVENADASVVLTERGDLEPVARHPDFRMFACMNPATDVGKKDLPPGLRMRFTEIYSPPPDDDTEALIAIVKQYLGDAVAGDRSAILDTAEFYMAIKGLSRVRDIVDGTNTPPHFSMRTLARALTFAVDVAPTFGLRRGLYEGCLMTFTMSLNEPSMKLAHDLCVKHLLNGLRNPKAVLRQQPAVPGGRDQEDFVRFGHYWLKRGPETILADQTYVITPSVQRKLSDLARIILTGKYPVLIQGPTSAGKTSAVEYLAKQTGHRFVRINNHEHTDIQEYLGTYASDPTTGKLAFREGLLVTAVRRGDWLVLDELNLAPTDVLEALNRLLDDNRELVIPETGEVVRPHPHFMLFATQNPPGLYAGRKVLSRAFRNRFLEVHFEDVPQEELQTILCQRCVIAPSYAQKIVQVFQELQHFRQAARMFESRDSYATLRDLFRWAGRDVMSYQQLAENGYILLAERARKDEDKVIVKQVLETTMKVKIDETSLYTISSDASSAFGRLGLPMPTTNNKRVVWTTAMQRLFTLVASAARYDEPILLIGETGAGKTSVCEVLAQVLKRELYSISCHQNMETADILGSQRPVRDRTGRLTTVIQKLQAFALEALGSEIAQPASPSSAWISETIERFERSVSDPLHVERLRVYKLEAAQCEALFEWHDGPLVHAMRQGGVLLLDELSLADDSVLERLNSVLEPSKTLVLAEKGGSDADVIRGSPGFQIVATMNPGGDFGKKELSPALRNRFTEIWVPAITDYDDLLQIMDQSWTAESLKQCSNMVISFFRWFNDNVLEHTQSGIGLRDLLSWIVFSNNCIELLRMSLPEIFEHAARLIVIDGLELLPGLAGLSKDRIASVRESALSEVRRLSASLRSSTDPEVGKTDEVISTSSHFGIGPFLLRKGPVPNDPQALPFAMQAPTTLDNLLRVLRACQLPKSILLEGSPGVGKTTLVQALADASGRHLCRINLSEQTDLIDLFGSDLPVAGGQAGEFAWQDAAFLTAMRKGQWVLLDEMNLASQAILEGLNAVLDHRGSVFIPELGRSFDKHPDFRVFAAQNPVQQGGGRKGLPKSFLNRFTKVYVQEHQQSDLRTICYHLYPEVELPIINGVIEFNGRLQQAVMHDRLFGYEGSPWEFNLRDIIRCFRLMLAPTGFETESPLLDAVRTVYVARFRTAADQKAVTQLFQDVMQMELDSERQPWPSITAGGLQVGHAFSVRTSSALHDTKRLVVLPQILRAQEALLRTVSAGWLTILVGTSGNGKRSLVRQTAQILGTRLSEYSMHPAVDTMEMLGSFEQSDRLRHLAHLVRRLLNTSKACQSSEQLNTLKLDRNVSILQRYDDAPREADVPGVELAFLQVLEEMDGTLCNTVAYDLKQELSMLLSSQSASSFEWVDGPLVTAIKTGGWYLINDANLCSSSVLDRLNSLCELNGTLILSERGNLEEGVEIIKPHPNFRLFMAFDPRNGELSRAMRNRGVEIALTDRLDMNRVRVGVTEESAITGYSRDAHCEYSSALQLLDLGNRDAHPLDVMAATFGRLFAGQTLNSVADAFVILRGLSQNDDDVVNTQAIQAQLRKSLHSALESYSEKQYARTHLSEIFKEYLPLEPSTNLQLAHFSKEREVGRFMSLLIWNELLPTVTISRSDVGQSVAAFVKAVRSVISCSAPLIFGSMAGSQMHLDDLLLLADVLHVLNDTGKKDLVDFTLVHVLLNHYKPRSDHIVDAELKRSYEALQRHTEPTTGLSQTSLWISMRQPVAHTKVLAAVQSMLEAHVDLWPTLGMRMIQALASLAFDEPDPAADDMLDKMLQAWKDLPTSRSEQPSGRILTQLRVASWKMARSSLYRPQRSQKRAFNSYTRLVVTLGQLKNFPLHSFSYGQERKLINVQNLDTQAIWINLSGSLTALWEDQADDVALPDASNLLQPINLLSALSLRMVKALRIGDIKRNSADLQHALALLELSMLDGTADIYEHNLDLAVVFLLKTVLSTVTVAERHSALASHDLSLILDGKQPLSERTLALQSLATDYLPQEVANALETCVPRTPMQPGQLWLASALVFARLYVPDIPLDPAVEQHCTVLLNDSKHSRLQAEYEVAYAAEIKLTGAARSGLIRSLQQALEVTAAYTSNDNHAIERAHYDARLAVIPAFYQETQRFFNNVHSAGQLRNLSDRISAGETVALQEEENFQSASQAFISRLTVSYELLEDLVQPLQMGIRAAKLGLRLIAYSERQKQAHLQKPRTTRAMSSLASYPAIIEANPLMELSLSMAGDLSSHSGAQALIALEAVSLLQSGKCSWNHVSDVVARAYHILVSLWIADYNANRRAEQVTESLYRQRKTEYDDVPDAEREARELMAMFPQYESWEDDDEEIATASRSKTYLTHDDVLQIHKLHMQIFAGHSRDRTAYDTARVSALARIMEQNPDILSSNLDASSVCLQIAVLAQRRFGDSEAVDAQSYSFYTSPNMPEMAKVLDLLTRIETKLRRTLEEFPDQMVLQHLLDRCENIRSISATSPVARMLAALEQLLTHTEDWQAYANRENSLKPFQEEIIQLIISWRRLELSGWARLLDQEAESYASDTSEWWFRLYQLLILGMANQEDSNENLAAKEGDHMTQALPLIIDYLESSTIGRFSSRMQLLRSYVTLIRRSRQLSDHKHMQRAARVLSSLIQRFAQFESKVAEAINQQRQPLDRAISDFIKLATWKDINIESMRASARKTHAQLYKSIRKFRDVLKQPILPILRAGPTEVVDAVEKDSQLAALEDSDFPIALAVDSRMQDNLVVPEHLHQLGKTFKKFKNVLNANGWSALDRGHEELEDLATEIVETSTALQKETPGSLTEENKKTVANLQTRKRKAFADLLKAMRALGFSAKTRADQLARQASLVWLSDLCSLDLEISHWQPELGDLLERLEQYHHRLGFTLPAMRESLRGHSDDFVTQDLQRAHGFAENVFATALRYREGLQGLVKETVSLERTFHRLETISSHHIVAGGQWAQAWSQTVYDSLVILIGSLEEASRRLSEVVSLKLLQESGDAGSIVLRLYSSGQEHLTRVGKVVTDLRDTGLSLLIQTDVDNLRAGHDFATTCSKELLLSLEAAPALDFVLRPLVSISEQSPAVPEIPRCSSARSDVWNQTDLLLDELLVVAQAHSRYSASHSTDGESPKLMVSLDASCAALLQTYRPQSILEKISLLHLSAIPNPEEGSTDNKLGHNLARCVPFLRQYIIALRSGTRTLANALKSTYKLDHILVKLFRTLAEKGYCKPSDTNEDDSKGGEGQEIEGMGLGAGTGKSNVSNEIEDESQVEGLKDEEQDEDDADQGEKQDKEDQAIEMGDDFEGNLSDAEGENSDDEGDDDEEKGDDDLDEQVGDVDPEAVDDKFWGEENDDDEEGTDDKTERKDGDQGDDSEMTAKEDEQKQDRKKESVPEPSTTEDDEENDAKPEDDQAAEEDGEDDAPGEENEDEQTNEPSKDVDANVPEAEILDLPDGMDLDQDSDEGELEDNDEDVASNVAEDEKEDGLDNQEDDGSVADEANAAGSEEGDADMEDEDRLDAHADEETSEDKGDAAEETRGENGQGDAGVQGDQEDSGDATAPTEDQREGQEAQQKESQSEEASSVMQNGQNNAEQDQTDLANQGGEIAQATGAQQQDRSLGDKLQDIHRMINEILERSGDDARLENKQAEEQATKQVEHVREDEDSEMQALGAAGPEDHEKLADLAIVDEQAESHDQAMDVDEEPSDDPSSRQENSSSHVQDIDVKPDVSDEKALTRSQIDHRGDDMVDAQNTSDSADALLEDDDTKLEAGEHSEDKPDSSEVELALQSWIESGRDDQSGEDLWRRYSTLTSDLSYHLCEQLRLILQPTLATRLQGDYRTGKRLNMRKIIPYIASEYTKDKIWLRRTKPSRREYQVLLSLDDSRSMADTKSVHLAYQTLALVSQALTKLEVGQIGIARFGENVEILHDFNSNAFSDAEGSRIMNTFTFQQHRTDVAKLVGNSLDVLADARRAQSSSSSGDLWQLEIIISDGVCQDHAQLRKLLRRALQERVMIVFLVIDSLKPPPSSTEMAAVPVNRPSILNMQTVAYKEVNGEMKIEMERYLDTFPFEYYVVLRDVEALPEVLSETLRQWMARVSTSEE